MMRAAALVTLVLLADPGSAAAQTYPTLTQPVNDFAGVIDASSKAEMDRRIRALEAGTPKHDAVVVVTVETIAPAQSIEMYATKLFERAGIGQKGQNNGLLVLLAKTERQVRIEVGYDLEEFVPDGYAGDTIRQEMLPAFRRGDYGAGLLAGTTRLINRIADKRGVTLADVPKPAKSRDSAGDLARALPLILLALFVLMRALSRRGPRSRFRRGGWGGPFIGGFGGGGWGGGFGGGGFGGGGGGFGGFGGGISGGGGASGRW
ncbi:MAG TPA: TPM domain-containing protein [Vicinamibacterales bacterium]|nr:TPM domain-containing protein [Vicinamibacterales bacterium]